MKLISVERARETAEALLPDPFLRLAVRAVLENTAGEVVHCGECRHWEKCESSLIGEVMCCTGQGDCKIQKDAGDFCSRGERREPEEQSIF